jgi:carboxyl-terminal processing protease
MWGALLLASVAAALLLILLLPERCAPWWIVALLLATLASGAAYVWKAKEDADFTFFFALPGLFVTALVLLVAAVARSVRAFRKNKQVSRAWYTFRKAGAALALLIVGFSSVRVWQAKAWLALETEGAPLRGERTKTDLSAKSWSEAFAGLRDTLVAGYPFTEWRRMDWVGLHAQYASQIAEAEKGKDQRAYYRALRSFTWRIPDGHVGVEGDDLGLASEETGGWFGLELATLEDGRVVASRIAPGGNAARAGIEFGTEIVAWDGLPTHQALERVEVIWSANPPATNEARRVQQEKWLVRAKGGSSVEVTFLKHGETSQRSVTLTAEKKEAADEELSFPREFFLSSAVETGMLPGNFGYIQIKYELPTLFSIYPEEKIRRAVADFLEKRVPGVIIDVRGNHGGADAMVPRMMAFFITRAGIYEYPGVLNHATGKFDVREDAPVRIAPREPHYSGKVALLIDEETVSSGEGFPLVLKGLPNVRVFGWRGTAGFFAINSKSVKLPGGYTVYFPQAQSVGSDRRIQVDSDHTGKGGVEPDVRVPLNEATLRGQFQDGKDMVLERAKEWLRER